MALLFVSNSDDPHEWIDALRAADSNLDVRVHPDIGDPADIDAALVWRPPAGLLASLPNLQVIFSLGAGVDAVLRDDSVPAHLPLVRLVDPGLTQGMVDYVIWQVMDWHRNGPAYRAQQADRRWQRQPEPLTGARRVGLLGLGQLGGAAAKALAGLGFQVHGWARSAKQIDAITCHAGPDGLAAMAAQVDCVVCLLPLTPQTTGILGANLFDQAPRGLHVINAGRGGHVADDDLLAALHSGQVGGAALDVFHTEPLPADHPFWTHPKITITPHVASVTRPETAAPVVLDNWRRLKQGQPVPHLVDRERGY